MAIVLEEFKVDFFFLRQFWIQTYCFLVMCPSFYLTALPATGRFGQKSLPLRPCLHRVLLPFTLWVVSSIFLRLLPSVVSLKTRAMVWSILKRVQISTYSTPAVSPILPIKNAGMRFAAHSDMLLMPKSLLSVVMHSLNHRKFHPYPA